MLTQNVIDEVVAAYFTHLTAMNPDRWIEHFAEDAISYDPVGHPPSKVHAGYREFFAHMKHLFEQWETATEHVFIAGNEAAVKWTIEAVTKNRKSVIFEGITVFEINEMGKIKTTRAYWNPEEMIAQIKE